MAARTKGRAKFDFRGREFVWYIERDHLLRIASSDKRCCVVYDFDFPDMIEIVGQEFPGAPLIKTRPIYLRVDPLTWTSIGALVDTVLSCVSDMRNPHLLAVKPPRSW